MSIKKIGIFTIEKWTASIKIDTISHHKDGFIESTDGDKITRLYFRNRLLFTFINPLSKEWEDADATED